MSSEKIAKKLVLILVNSTPMTATRKKAFKDVATGETYKNGENSKNKGKKENLRVNLIQVSYIQYSITF